VHMPRLGGQVLPQEREDLLPAVQRLLDAIHRPIIVEEAVTGVGVPMKLGYSPARPKA